jgi:hypothetical protein
MDGGVSVHARLVSGQSPERGREARKAAPRSAHGDWAPAPGRPDPVDVLQAQAATRVQELVPIRYLGRGASFDRAIDRFCEAYADQSELDHQRLAEAAAGGEIPAEAGV